MKLGCLLVFFFFEETLELTVYLHFGVQEMLLKQMIKQKVQRLMLLKETL